MSRFSLIWSSLFRRRIRTTLTLLSVVVAFLLFGLLRSVAAAFTVGVEIAGVDQLADSAVVLRCRFKVMPLEQWGVRREFLRRLKRAFDERGIEIPFPHVTVYPGVAKDGSAPELRIRQQGGEPGG